MNHPKRRYVRQITLLRPGEADVAIVTDLVDAELYPAAELLEHYLQRWGMYNLIQLIRGYVAAHQQRRTETISIENLFSKCIGK